MLSKDAMPYHLPTPACELRRQGGALDGSGWRADLDIEGGEIEEIGA
jgi:hypothetical protein